MDFNKIIVVGIAGLVVLCFVFGMGVCVGTRRADFSFKWAEQYHQNFAGPQQGFLGNMMDMKNDFINANGVIGEIISVKDNQIVIKGIDNVEKIIVVDERTTIMCQKQNLNLPELKIGDNIVTIGQPNDKGQVKASLIRKIPTQTKFDEKNVFECPKIKK